MAKSILVVEDYPETLKLFEQILTGEGFSVKAVETGEKALDAIAHKKFDLVVLDVMLPRIDGMEVCRRIKLAHKDLPVIAATAFDVPDIISRCKSAGFDEVIMKPFEPDRLIAAVNKHLL